VKTITYSAIVGNIDLPRDDNIKCFTDVLRNFPNPRLSAKMYKVLFHLFLPEDTEWSIWIDGNIKLKVSEDWLIEQTKPKEIGVFNHGERQCIYKEGHFCIEKGKGDPIEIEQQLLAYKRMGYPEDNGLSYCGVIVRKHTSQIKQLCEQWWAHICRYSIRDQISFPVVFGQYIQHLPTVPMHTNQYFERPKHGKRI
jgi:hypothetical protein